ncbi:hypothetical protein, partial [Salmonella enterica]|uniref:hypothetical protein n=1 Tax=Salmonella enterica TaxID=28901 RepID=UPI001E33D40E
IVDILMHPPQFFHQIPHFLHLSQSLTHHFLPLLIQVQEPLNQFSVNEPVRLLRLTLCITEGPVSGKGNVAGRLDILGQALLEAKEGVDIKTRVRDNVDSTYKSHIERS